MKDKDFLQCYGSLRYIGGKRKCIQMGLFDYFPKHLYYVEPAMGGGAVAFGKKPALATFLNDKSLNLINIYKCIQYYGNELIESVYNTIIHKHEWERIKELSKNTIFENKYNFELPENKDFMLENAKNELILKYFGFLGKGDTIMFQANNSKKTIEITIKNIYKKIRECNFQINCNDFEPFIKNISTKNVSRIDKWFCYNDFPYLNTGNNYDADCQFAEADLRRAIEINIEKGWLFAFSEFDSPEVLNIAKDYKLNINYLGERRQFAFKNKRMEIILTNYNVCGKNTQTKMF